MTDIDYSVREFIHLRPSFRDDVSILVQREGDERCFVIEDPVRGKFYRLGEPEYRFISLLDGATTIEAALIQNARDLGRDALGEHDATVVLNWLSETGLLRSESGLDPVLTMESRDERNASKLFGRLNPLFVRVPLGNPDSILTRIRPVTRFLFSPGAFLVWVCVVVGGLYQIIDNFNRFATEASSILAVSNWISLLVIWALLKLVHELFHGLVCKHYGGAVNEAGVIMILLAPIGYVDATSSWKFPSRWQRMFTAAAGIYIEFFIAGIAAWIWADIEPGAFRDICYNIILIASINTLLFNANPLMKFDGYYVFSDLVNVPNLYVDGAAYVKYVAKRALLGISCSFPGRGTREDWIVRIYGVLSFLWRVLVIATLLIVASSLLNGLGLILAILAVCVILVVPGLRFIKYLVTGNDQERPRALRFVMIVLLLAGAGYLGLFQFEWNQTITAHGIVEFRAIDEYRTEHPATVEAVHVRDGEKVSTGQLLVTLSNPDLALTVAGQRNTLDQLQLQRKKLLSEKKIAEYQAMEDRVTAMKSQVTENTELLENLNIVASASGIVLLPDFDSLVGRYVDNTKVLLTVARSDERELRIAVPQREVNRLVTTEDATIPFFLPGRPGIKTTLRMMTPVASDTVVNQSLSALGGGPIPVVSDETENYRLTEPHFWIFAELRDKIQNQLGAGERGLVRLDGKPISLGFLWLRSVRDWVERIRAQVQR